MIKRYDKIGVFDSGMGGLTVLSEIERLLPSENIIYYADSQNCPYGDKTKEEILNFTLNSIQKLIDLGVKLVVVACNTASNSAIKVVREKFPQINFIAMEPAVKPAIEQTKTGNIAVIATLSTIKGESLRALCAKHSETTNIYTLATPRLVEIVENDLENTPESKNTINDYLSNILGKDIDTLVLGCTHYSFLKDDVTGLLENHGIKIVDAAEAVAKQTQRVLNKANLTNDSDEKGTIEFMSSQTQDYNIKLKQKYDKYTQRWRK